MNVVADLAAVAVAAPMAAVVLTALAMHQPTACSQCTPLKLASAIP